MLHFADRLTAACRAKGNALCVGLDPRWEQLPLALRDIVANQVNGMAGAYLEFLLRVIEIVGPLVPVVKPQSAFFEACGPAGMQSLRLVLAHAFRQRLVVILD